tara:strand:- start:22271 stop:22684 length:414 start_codon:yes stop_codon:yes gene_type:complete
MKSKKYISEVILYGVIAAIAIAIAIATAWFTHRNEDVSTIVQRGNFEKYGVTDEHKVILYGADYCPACQELKSVLQKYGVKYKYLELKTQPRSFEALREDNINQIPVLIIENMMIVGFSASLTQEALHEKNLIFTGG